MRKLVRALWDRLPFSRTVSEWWSAAIRWLEQERIFGKSTLWFVSGWRLGLIALIVAIVYPQEFDDSFVLSGIYVGIYVLLALGLNIVVGYAGLLDLGYVAFFIIGAYTYASLSIGFLHDANGKLVTVPIVSFWWILPLGALFAGIAGAILGAPTLRLRGDYLAIVTLGFGEITKIFVLNVKFFGGANGIDANSAPQVNTPLGVVDFGNVLDHSAFYYLVLAAVVLVVIIVTLLRNSSLGRAWIAIREDETAAASSGVNLVRTKLMAFATGAAIGGLGGVLSAAVIPIVSPDEFNFSISLTILVMIVLGGIGSIPGVIVGAIVLEYFSVQLAGQLNDFIHNNPLVSGVGAPFHSLVAHDFNQDKFLLFGIVLLAMVLLRPQGIIPDRRRQRELRQATSVEEASAVGIIALEQAGASVSGMGSEDTTEYTGPGSDAQGREE